VAVRLLDVEPFEALEVGVEGAGRGEIRAVVGFGSGEPVGQPAAGAADSENGEFHGSGLLPSVIDASSGSLSLWATVLHTEPLDRCAVDPQNGCSGFPYLGLAAS